MTYTVDAKRWAQGWELHIRDENGDVGVTQCRTLAKAEATVHDYLETLLERDVRNEPIRVTPHLNKQLAAEARQARAATKAAFLKQQAAARDLRKAARDLRDAGLSVSDTAYVLEVTPGRVSQLVNS